MKMLKKVRNSVIALALVGALTIPMAAQAAYWWCVCEIGEDYWICYCVVDNDSDED